ncbi:IclR family transcriptional regulator [Georgenia sp. TF02-10]|nr:IclR family transcriptional regulator [Georgenia sp. TF02-10]
MSLFEYLAKVRSATFADVVRDLELPSSSAYELLSTALRRRFVAFNETTREYRLGIRLWELAQASTGEVPLAELAQPLMEQLTARTEETVQLAQLDGLDNIYLAISESPHPMKLVSSVGSRLPAHTTGLGKTLLAGLSDDELRRRLEGVALEAMTDNTITDTEELLREVQRIRQNGYGEDREEYVIGCRCIAIPVRAKDGSTLAAMSVSAPTPRLTPRIERAIHEELARTVTELQEVLNDL